MQTLVSFERRDPEGAVLIVTNMWPLAGREGSGVFVRRQVDSLVKAGVRCDVLVVHGYRSPRAYAAAARLLARLSLSGTGRYQLVHAHGGETAFPTRFYRAPLVVSYCGSDLLGAADGNGSVPPSWRVRRRVVREHARLARATITKTLELERCLPAAVQARNTVIPNGVDRDVFRPLPRAQARAELGWDADEGVALFAADPRIALKRVELAEAACAAARRRGWQGRLHVAASVPPDRMPLLMNAADCLVLTSTTEGSPNVVKEALACNLPVVSTGVGDVARLLAGVAPSAVSEADADALASALLECTREGYRSNGRERTAWLDEGLIAARIIAVYRRTATNAAF
jgi:glycosyltransferase involved in cell wall biosynthesis